MIKAFAWSGLVVVVLAVGAVVALTIWPQDEDTQCFAEFDPSASAEAAAAKGRAVSFDVFHQSGNDEGAFIFQTGKTGDDAIPLERSFDRVVRQHHGHFGGNCVAKGAFD